MARQRAGTRQAGGRGAVLAACAMAVAVLAGAQGAEETVLSAFKYLEGGPAYKEWVSAQEGLYGIVYITESCPECANTQNALELAADAMRISTGKKIPLGLLDCQPDFSGMEWAMDELGLEQIFPSIVFFEAKKDEDAKVVWKIQNGLEKDSLFNIMMKLSGHLVFPRKLKEVTKMLRLGVHNVVVAFIEPGDPDEAQKLRVIEDFVNLNKMAQVQKIGGSGPNAREWDAAKKKFGISQTTFAVLQTTFSAEMNSDASKGHAFMTTFEDVDALTRFYKVHVVSDVHWDDGSALGALAMTKHIWAAQGEGRPGKDGVVVLSSSACLPKKRTEVKKLAKQIFPLISKFPNLLFTINTDYRRQFDPEFDLRADEGIDPWKYTAREIRAIGTATATAASRNLKVILVAVPKGTALEDASSNVKSKLVLDQLPLQKKNRAYPQGWGIPATEKASYRGDKIDVEEMERKLQELLRQDSEL